MFKLRPLILALVSLAASMPARGLESGAKSLFEDEGSTVMMSREPTQEAATRAPKVRREAAPRPRIEQNSQHAATHTSRGPAPTSAPRSYGGVQYWIELVRADGSSVRVAPSHRFRSGDRVALKIKSNTSGYLYVLNEGSTGRQTMLFPANPALPAKIAPRTTYRIPDHGLIRFDDNPGREEIGILLTESPVPTASGPAVPKGQTAAPAAAGTAVSYSDCRGAKDLEVVGDLGCLQERHGSKDLVVEEDTASPEPPAYAVAPMTDLEGGKMLGVRFQLRHD